MNSSKLKWFLIVLFLAANVFFFIQYYNYSELLNNYTDKELDTAVEILNGRGVKIDRSVIPLTKTVAPVLKLEYSDDSTEEIANHVMNGSFASYMLPSGVSYTNDSETLIFYDSHSFEYTVTNASIPNEEIIERLKSEKPSDKMRSYVKALLGKLFYQPLTAQHKITFKLLSSLEIESTVLIRVQQEINGTPIDRSEIIACFENDRLQFIKGNIFTSDETSSLNTDSLDIINLLFKIDANNNEIVMVDEVYYPVTTDNGSLYLTPSYMLTYGNGDVHVWDATSSSQRY